MTIALLTRGYIQEVRPAVADVPAFPSVKAQDDGINVIGSSQLAPQIKAQDDSVKVKQQDDGVKVLPSDSSTIIKIKPC